MAMYTRSKHALNAFTQHSSPEWPGRTRLRSHFGHHRSRQRLIFAAQPDYDDKQVVPEIPGSQQQPSPTTSQMQQPQQPSAQQVQPDSRQQQQQQQQLQQQQQQSQQRPQPAASPPQQQQQQPTARSPQDIGWPSKLLRGLRHMPATLIAFILGGAGTWLLLWGWARGTPMRRSHPYCFTMTFSEASKLDVGTPIRMKGVQIGAVASVGLTHSNVEAVAQVLDSSNIIPLTSRVDINLLGLAADPWIDITPPAHASVRHDHGPHHPDCGRDGLIVCHNGRISGSQGGSTDFMMKFFLSQHDRTRVKSGEVVYHTKQA